MDKKMIIEGHKPIWSFWNIDDFLEIITLSKITGRKPACFEIGLKGFSNLSKEISQLKIEIVPQKIYIEESISCGRENLNNFEVEIFNGRRKIMIKKERNYGNHGTTEEKTHFIETDIKLTARCYFLNNEELISQIRKAAIENSPLTIICKGDLIMIWPHVIEIKHLKDLRPINISLGFTEVE